LPYVQIFASGGLDEFKIEELLRAGAPIDGFGVGTKVGVSADAPWTDCAYKLVEYEGRPTMKLSHEKKTLPGSKQVFRFYDAKGNYLHDVIGRADEKIAGAEPLLHQVMVSGKSINSEPSLPELRMKFRQEFARLPEAQKKLRVPEPYDVRVSQSLESLGREVARQTLHRETGAEV
jgi:nicotinate phosphoribosyltransferase